ncbi:MAG: quinone oxidoreductase [Candidatus Omnitrophota bacterium]|nr:quinone oxidoreductase [Candidatus Omnitrophota bacterium]
MTHALRLYEPGAPDVMKWEEVDVGKPSKGELRLRHTAVGLNYIDTYHRSGLYPLALPAILGLEAAGVIEEMGPGVGGFKVGDRVAYGTGPAGAYSEARIIPASQVVKIGRGISDEVAAAIMLKGMTVEYLFCRTYPLRKGQTILFHAAAGGVGLIACQWAKHLGCTVIGTVGSSEKAELARQHGCAHTILYREENIVDRVMEITKGKGVPIVYDSVGKDTFLQSIECLHRRGVLVSFGQASGAIPDVNLQVFAPKSLYLTRPMLFGYTATREELELSAKRLFGVIQKGIVKVRIGQRYPLKEAVGAHQDLEARKLTGSTVFIP